MNAWDELLKWVAEYVGQMANVVMIIKKEK